MELLLIRHAEPVKVVDASGPADPALGDRGRRQAELLAGYLEDLDAVYSSPMRRAGQTARILADAAGHAVVTVDGLAEFDRLDTTYIPVEEMKATNDERYLAMLNDDYSLYGVDMAEFRREVVRTVEGVIAEHAGQRVAAVCHGGVINSYLGHILGITRNSFFAPDYTSVHRVAASRSGVRSVLGLNDTGHLRGQDLLASTA